MTMADQYEHQSRSFESRHRFERQNVFSMLPAIYAASRAQGQQLLKAAGGLSIVEWRTLWDLTEVGSMSVRELATLQSADHSLLSRALPDIRKKGLVTMTRSEQDGRQMIVRITPKGRQAYRRAAPIMRRRREGLRACYTEQELDQFVEYLHRLEEFLHIPVDELLEQNDPS